MNTSNDELRKEWLDSRKPIIRVKDGAKPFGRNYIADKFMNHQLLTVRQRVVMVLRCGYGMPLAVISRLLICSRKTVYDHLNAAEANLAQDSTLMLLLKKSEHRGKRSQKEE